MSKKLLWIFALMFSFMLNQIVFADPAICKESLNKMVQSLNLDDTQKTKIKPIIDQMKSSVKTAASQMDDIRTQLTQQVYSASMDQSTVNDLVDKKAKLIGDMMKAKVMATNQVYNILNPQQKQKLQGMIKNMEEKIAAEFKQCEQD